MQPRDFQRLFSHIDTGDESALLRHRLGQHAAAATHVEDSLARKGGMLVDPVETYRVDVMQRTHRSFAVPPAWRPAR